jgi:2-methylcitrate dehydratase PrpD
MLKPLHAGRAAQSGLLAARYAARGGEAPRRALEGPDGYLRALSGHEGGPDLADLGPPRAIMGAYYKLHAACRHVHPAVDAVLDLFGRDGLVPAQVVEVHVRTHEVAERLTRRPGRVADLGGARFSLPFAVSLAALRGSVGPEQFTPAALADEELWGFAERVRVVADPDLTARYPAERGAVVTLRLADGAERSARVVHPRGEPENPVSSEELAAKFLVNARPVLGDHRANQVLALVRRLPELQVRELMEVTRR